MISFFVPGIPAPKGSAKGFVVKGRAVITHANARTKPWEQAVAGTLLTHEYPRHVDAPFAVDAEFYLPRPKSHFGKSGLRASAPRFPTVKPDGDKLLRLILDALTVAGVWVDDSRAIDITARKRYASETQPPGVSIQVGVMP